ncbi:hypothetical protein ES703_66391 [subsurface metagenome]
MKEIGLIFSAEMAQANMLGQKTMTRRTRGLNKINEDPDLWEKTPTLNPSVWAFYQGPKDKPTELIRIKSPFDQVGDKIWQRETWATELRLDHLSPSEIGEAATVPVWYKADGKHLSILELGKWRSPLFMPRWASRFATPITKLPVPVRLQEITLEDAKREAPPFPWDVAEKERNYRYAFLVLWDSKNAAKGLGWDFNPWVWPIVYKGN